jgi:thiol-disulfide isomerase/thioredoxin
VNDKIFLALLLIALLGVGGAIVGYRTFFKPHQGYMDEDSDMALLIPHPLDVETSLPEFTLPDLAEKPQSSTQWLGQVLILNFWATWCPPCRREIPEFIALQQELGPRGIQFVGIALDKPAAVRDFAQTTEFNYPILLGDEDRTFELFRKLGNRQFGLPFSVIFDRTGQVVYSILGELAPEVVRGQVMPLL